VVRGWRGGGKATSKQHSRAEAPRPARRGGGPSRRPGAGGGGSAAAEALEAGPAAGVAPRAGVAAGVAVADTEGPLAVHRAAAGAHGLAADGAGLAGGEVRTAGLHGNGPPGTVLVNWCAGSL